MVEDAKFKDLINQLNSLGYNQYQLNRIIEETVGTLDLSNLTITQNNELLETLQGYVDFAIRCHNSLK